MAKSASKVDQIDSLVKEGLSEPNVVFSRIKIMAKSADWKVREVAATALVRISKKHSGAIIEQMEKWAGDKDENIRRTSVESLRGIARLAPNSVLSILEKLKTDGSLYVKKSVANIMRDASKGDPKLISALCEKWLKVKNENTYWIIKNGVKKLPANEQNRILKKILKKV